METIIYGLCASIVLLWSVNAIRFYKTQYKNKFYKYIYSNFFEYYFKFTNKHDASKSSYIKNRVGENRIIFNSYLNDKYIPIHELVTIITSKGILACYIFTSSGAVIGRDSDSYLYIKRDGKNYRIQGVKDTMDKHIKNIKEKCNVDNVDICYFFKNDCNFENFKTKEKCAIYKDAIKILNEENGSISSENIELYYKELTTHLKENKNG